MECRLTENRNCVGLCLEAPPSGKTAGQGGKTVVLWPYQEIQECVCKRILWVAAFSRFALIEIWESLSEKGSRGDISNDNKIMALHIFEGHEYY